MAPSLACPGLSGLHCLLMLMLEARPMLLRLMASAHLSLLGLHTSDVMLSCTLCDSARMFWYCRMVWTLVRLFWCCSHKYDVAMTSQAWT